MATREEMIASLSAGSPGGGGSVSREDMIKSLSGPQKEKERWYEDFGEGIAVSGLETYYGAKDLFGKLDDDDRATLKDWKEDAAESGWGTAGQVVGEIGQMLIPGGAAAKGLKLASKAQKLGRMGRFGADAAGGAAVSALQLPEEGESRLTNAMKAIAGAGAGSLAGAGLQKAVGGITKSRAAQKLIDEGVELTPGQAAKGGIPKLLEYQLERIPGLSKAVKSLKGQSEESFNRVALSKAALPGVSITKSGKEGFDQLRDSYNKAYDDAWGSAVRPSNKDMVGMSNFIFEAGKSSASKSPYKNIAASLKEMSSDFNPSTVKRLDRMIRDERNTNWAGGLSDETLDSNLKTIQSMLADAIGGTAKSRLKTINSSYNKLISIRKASQYIGARKKGGQFTPDELLRGTKVGGGLEDLAVAGAQTLGRKDPLSIFGKTTRYLAEQSPGVPGAESLLKFAGKRMMGEGKEQAAVKALIEALRKTGLSSSRIGASLGA